MYRVFIEYQKGVFDHLRVAQGDFTDINSASRWTNGAVTVSARKVINTIDNQVVLEQGTFQTIKL